MTGFVLKLLVCISLSLPPARECFGSHPSCSAGSGASLFASSLLPLSTFSLCSPRWGFPAKQQKKVPWKTGRQKKKWQKKQAEATSPKPLLIVVSTFNRTSVTVNKNKHCQGPSEQPGSVTSCILFSDPAWVLWWWGKRPECFPLHHRETKIQALPFPPLNKPRTLNHLSFFKCAVSCTELLVPSLLDIKKNFHSS